MRTFIFIKRVGTFNNIHQHIIGMIQSDTFPSEQNMPESKFYHCQCIEISEKCDIDLGRILN